MSATEGHLHALLALSENAIHSEARKTLVQSLIGEQLQVLNQEILETCTTRELHEGLTIALLDFQKGNRGAGGEAAATPNGESSTFIQEDFRS
jgi:hypothetical protein